MATIVVRRLWNKNTPTIRFLYNRGCVVRSQSHAFCASQLGKPLRYPLLEKHSSPCHYLIGKSFSQKTENDDDVQPIKKLSLFQKFKQMYRDYWYVLVPVHAITSVGWFGAFYYTAKSGIDIVSIMESWSVSEIIINPLRDSSMGYLAVSYALYKITTPIRYMVTLGGTTLSIKYLKEWGYIKPVPTSQQLKDMYLEKRENIMESVRGRKDDLKMRTGQFKKKQNKIIGGLEKSIKSKIADTKDQLNEKKNDFMSELQKPLKVKRRKDQ